MPLVTGAVGLFVGWSAARFESASAAQPQKISVEDKTSRKIRVCLTSLKADCESLLRDIHSRILVMDIAEGVLPASISNPDRLEAIYSNLGLDDEWDPIRKRIDRVRLCVWGLQSRHRTAVMDDQIAAGGREHQDQDYSLLTSGISETIARIEACLWALDHRARCI